MDSRTHQEAATASAATQPSSSFSKSCTIEELKEHGAIVSASRQESPAASTSAQSDSPSSKTYTIEQLKAHGRKLSVSTSEYPHPFVVEDSEDEIDLPNLIPNYFADTTTKHMVEAPCPYEDPCKQMPDSKHSAQAVAAEIDWDHMPGLTRVDDHLGGGDEGWSYADMPYEPVKNVQNQARDQQAFNNLNRSDDTSTNNEAITSKLVEADTEGSKGQAKNSVPTASDASYVTLHATSAAEVRPEDYMKTPQGLNEATSKENDPEETDTAPEGKRLGWIEVFRRMILG